MRTHRSRKREREKKGRKLYLSSVFRDSHVHSSLLSKEKRNSAYKLN